MEDRKPYIIQLGHSAREAAGVLTQADDTAIDQTLFAIADILGKEEAAILAANAIDLETAAAKDIGKAALDRLSLSKERLSGIRDSVLTIRDLENPCGKVLEDWVRPNGLKIQKVAVPIGVLGMIYESRPNVTIDAAALSLKSRNAIILRGGSECFETNTVLHRLIQNALIENGLPASCVQFVASRDRGYVGDMLNAAGLIDVMIPRGGKSLTSRVMSEAKMPVFAHLDGNCHVYVDSSADPAMALSVINNAKLRRTGICGAAESLLFDERTDEKTVMAILSMLSDSGVEIVGDERMCRIHKAALPATEEDWSAEYLDKKISVKFVKDVRDAALHINTYGSHHTDAIIASDDAAADYFLKNVDSAIVVRNASTQFADGGEFGFGAEIGIGTGKLHARGPVGVKQLVTFKYVVRGDGQVRV